MLIDIIFAVLIFFACLKGLRKGLIIALFSIIAFIVGIAAALKLSAYIALRLSENINISGKWIPVFSFILVFLVVVLLVNMGGRLIKKTFQLVILGWLDKLAGVLLFIVLYSIIYSVFLFYAVQLHLIKTEVTATSQVYPYIQPLAPRIINLLGSAVPFFKDIFVQLQHFFEVVSNKIRH